MEDASLGVAPWGWADVVVAGAMFSEGAGAATPLGGVTAGAADLLIGGGAALVPPDDPEHMAGSLGGMFVTPLADFLSSFVVKCLRRLR